jgi:hypothetical protein
MGPNVAEMDGDGMGGGVGYAVCCACAEVWRLAFAEAFG